MSLAGKRVLVTGGGSGIGADMARAFAAGGASVTVSGRNAAALAEAAAGTAIRSVVADVTEEAAVVRLFAEAGPQDIVIANAGIAASAPFAKTSLEEWNRILTTNATGVFLTFREALKGMPKDWGRLIAIASIAGLRGGAYIAPYTASKHAVVGLVRALALELGKTGITANAICPGYIDTPMTERSVANVVARTGKTEAEARAYFDSLSPKGRMVQPAEVTAMALWLAGPGTDMVNGQALALNGGEP